jgi:hypothetical protein
LSRPQLVQPDQVIGHPKDVHRQQQRRDGILQHGHRQREQRDQEDGGAEEAPPQAAPAEPQQVPGLVERKHDQREHDGHGVVASERAGEHDPSSR